MKPYWNKVGRLWVPFAVAILCIGFANRSLAQDECPKVSGFGEPGDVIVECDLDGTANVSLFPVVGNGTDKFVCATIECGPGALSGGFDPGVHCMPSGNNWKPLPICHYDTPSAPKPFVKFMDLNGDELKDCSPVPLDVPPLPQCGGCPTIESLIIDLPACADVDKEGGLWPVALDAQISNKDQVEWAYRWNFGDGSKIEEIPVETPEAPKTTHKYHCPNTGDYHITLELFGCPGEEFYSDDLSDTVKFSSCFCPSIDDIVDEIDGCNVSVEPSVSGVCAAGVTQYIWLFEGGTPPDVTTLPSDPKATTTYTGTGSYEVKLILGGVGSGCTFSKEIHVTECGEDLPPESGLTVIKEDDEDPVTVGDSVIYTVTVTNNGSGTAKGVVLTDTLPSDVIFVSATPEEYDCSENAGVVVCKLGDIASSGSVNVVIKVTTTAEGTLSNTASVTSDSDIEQTTVKPSGDGDDGGNGEGDCLWCFCGGFWCCLLWGIFLVSVVTAIVSLAVALCNPGNKAAWVVFGIAVASVITFGLLLIFFCDVDACAVLLSLAGAGYASYAIVCGTNFVPCKSWLCQPTGIPGTDKEIANLLLIDVIFSLLVAILCAVLK